MSSIKKIRHARIRKEKEAWATISQEKNDELSLELIRFYQHHLTQMDRLIYIVELLKAENQLLRTKLKKSNAASTHSEETISNYHTKPRITCRPSCL